MRVKVKRALLSVWDKAGLIELARGLQELGVELISSGNTSTTLEAAGIPVTRVEAVTGSPEMLDGRVKTLHPKIHGGLLADLGKEQHRTDLDLHGIRPFELVVSNLYPFGERPGIETIDIGGPAMTRAAAKNHEWVTIITDPGQYGALLEELHANDGTVGPETRRAFALEAFARTAAYDAAIVEWLQQDEPLPRHIVIPLTRTEETLRYGENPHQHAARYRRSGTRSWWDEVVQHGGLALSYLNFYDADAAWQLVHDLGDRPTCAIIKHANPCGVAVDDALAAAYQRALECDERSAFGGIVALNRPIDQATVDRMVEGPQADLVIAPGYEPGTIEALQKKRKNTRILQATPPQAEKLDFRPLSGGFLVQDAHHFSSSRSDWRVVTKVAPTDEQWRDLELAWRICGHVKSNAIVLVKDGQAVGIGAGQQNRVESGEIAAKKADGRARGGACRERRVLSVPGRHRRGCRGRGCRGRPTGRRDARRCRHRTSRRVGTRNGVHRRTALPPLMAATLLDGQALLDEVKDDLRARIKRLGERGVTPGLGTILVGDDPPSHAYVRLKRENSAEVGINSVHTELPATTSQAELLDVVDRYNNDPGVDAYLVQVPLPPHLDEEAVLLAVDPNKDADGLHPVNLGKLVMGVRDAPRPCTPLGIQALLVRYNVPIVGQHVVIIGRGLTIGRPLVNLLSLKEPHANATVTVCHTGTKFLPEYTKIADIVVAAAGRPSILTKDMIRPGAAIVGPGATMQGRKVIPDVDEDCAEVAGWITPRIGGVGPTTRAMLLRQTVEAAERRAGIS